MSFHRLHAAAMCVACALLLGWGSTAHASATVSKFSLVLAANPTSIKPKQFNEQVIDRLNDQILTPRGYEGVKPISFAWAYDAQMRYFVRPNFAVDFGASQLRTVTKRTFQPAIGMAIEYSAEMLTVPVHVGGAYYLPPYNQGDFQARWYLEGGLMSLVYNRARFSAVEANTDSARSLGGNFRITARRDAPGYYFESGVHMFFASRYSVLLGVLYRSAVLRRPDVVLERATTHGLVRTPLGQAFDVDLSGVGGKMGLAIGF